MLSTPVSRRQFGCYFVKRSQMCEVAPEYPMLCVCVCVCVCVCAWEGEMGGYT